MPNANVWTDDWQFDGGKESWETSRRTRLPRGDKIGATLYEIDPGSTGGGYHFHHGAESS